MKHLELKIEQMHCGGCVSRVTAVLGNQPGVEVQHVDIGAARVAIADGGTAPAAITQALTEAGYPAKVAKIG